MTYAEPGQPGYHHVNCQPQQYWVNKVEALGYKFNAEYSESLREIAIKCVASVFNHSGHLQKILFFEKNEVLDSDTIE